MFGGFINGTRSNDIVALDYDKASNTCKIKQISENKIDPAYPIQRAGHAHAAFRETDAQGNLGNLGIYIFGGHDEENNKLNDLWKFDINQ